MTKRLCSIDVALVWFATLALSLPTGGHAAGFNAASVSPALVQVFTIANPPDVASPWQRLGIDKYEGSGVIIEGNRILTNAHVVSDAVSIGVKRQGTTRRYEATAEHVGHECDLAVLRVDDAEFFEGARSLEIGELPELRDNVEVYGFPIGGDSISITSGIVSRVELAAYSQSARELLLVQIDAAINEGNSGGPVIAGSKVVGIAVSTLEDAENVGYMVPAPVIRHFLEDIEDGRFDGFPSLGLEVQAVENKALRRSLGLEGEETGALVRRTSYGAGADGVLRSGDVVLAVDGTPIAADLTIALNTSQRIPFQYAIQRKQVGETVELSIARGEERLNKRVELRNEPWLVPGPQYGKKPSYLIFGGLLFQPLSVDYIRLFEDLPSDMANYYQYQNVRTPERRQIIVLSEVLEGPGNRGYHDFEGLIVKSVEGVTPRDMSHLVELIDDAEGLWFEAVTEEGDRVVLDLEKARAAGKSILRRYGIGKDRSPDLRAKE